MPCRKGDACADAGWPQECSQKQNVLDVSGYLLHRIVTLQWPFHLDRTPRQSEPGRHGVCRRDYLPNTGGNVEWVDSTLWPGCRCLRVCHGGHAHKEWLLYAFAALRGIPADRLCVYCHSSEGSQCRTRWRGDDNMKRKDEPYILAVDLGTSGCKTALISVTGVVAGWEFQEVPLLVLPGGGAEQDPEDWWSAFLATAGKLIHKKLVPVEDIVGVCCSTQGEGTVPVDRDGKQLMNCVLWMDMRGAANLRQITRGSVNVAGYDPIRLMRWIKLTGGAPALSGKDPSAHMLFIRDVFPDVYAKTFKFLNVPDYMNMRLCGRIAATPDSILTSWVTDNRDSAHVAYSPALIRNSGIDADKFPEIVACDSVLGEVKPV